ncbi:unnamed protein product [Owenia fusiformis]|uniref:Thioredoxin domain-containing protein n=1 Tax=Owenia fusiformis TaxID=6347 RepID=A0A8S4N389_OWEFU|nr:unnamed protein product [Owenia fusiformis]
MSQAAVHRLLSGVRCLRKTPQMFGTNPLFAAQQRWLTFNVQDEKDFKDRVLENDKPVLVDFTASWCGPCKILGPRLETIVAGYKGRVELAKVDIDEHQDLAIKFGISSVPTVIGMVKGEKKSQFVGVTEDDLIEAFIEKLLPPS